MMMKHSPSMTLLLISMLFFAFVLHHVHSIAVVDTDGNPVVPTNTYYLLSINSMDGLTTPGEAKLGKTENSTCSANVVIDAPKEHNHKNKTSKIRHGLPIRITVIGGSSGGGAPINVGDHISIEFVVNGSYCGSSTKWVAGSDENIDYGVSQAWVGVGGVEDHPGMNILAGYFTIGLMGSASGENFYNLAFISDEAPEGILNVVVVDQIDVKSSGWRLGAWDNGDLSELFGHFLFVKAG